MYRNYLLKGKTLAEAYEKLDMECPNLLINDEDKTELEGILLHIKSLRSVISKPNKINEILDKFDVRYSQNVNILGFDVHYLGYLFIQKPQLSWEVCLFAIVFKEDPLRQYALKQMGIHQIRLVRASTDLRIFLSKIGRGQYISAGDISVPRTLVPGLSEFWFRYEVEHLKQKKEPPLEADYEPVHLLPQIKEPGGVQITEDIMSLVEKLTS